MKKRRKIRTLATDLLIGSATGIAIGAMVVAMYAYWVLCIAG